MDFVVVETIEFAKDELFDPDVEALRKWDQMEQSVLR
jgi:hypothetical protein